MWKISTIIGTTIESTTSLETTIFDDNLQVTYVKYFVADFNSLSCEFKN